MRYCKHFIIPSSTFGWWPAWLSDNQDKIVIVNYPPYAEEFWESSIGKGQLYLKETKHKHFYP
jgi:hypothetical protein